MRNFTMLLSGIAIGVLAVVLAGCSGGGNRFQPEADSTERTVQFSEVSATCVGPLQPPVTSGGSGTEVTGIAGALITRLTLKIPPPTPANADAVLQTTQIAFVRNRQLYLMHADGSNQVQLAPGVAALDVDWFPDGARLAFIKFDNTTQTGQIYSINTDGTGLRQITDGTGDCTSLAVSHDGTKIAFAFSQKTPTQIFVIPAAGGQATQLTSGAFTDSDPTWSPDDTQLAFRRFNPNAVVAQIYLMDATGANQRALLGSTFANFNCLGPSWAPGGNNIAFSLAGTLAYADATSAPTDHIVRVAEGSWYDPDWSPDGSRLVFVNLEPTTSRLWSGDISGASLTPLTAMQSGVNELKPSWSPLLTQRRLIGNGGSLGKTAAGFIFGQQRNVVTSILTFNSTTPSQARVTTTTGINPGLTTYLFSITAPEKLTALAYINDLYTPPIVVIDDNTNAANNGALVSFNAQTGRIAAVLLYVTTRAMRQGAISVQGNTTIVHGPFLGVWDDTGHNRAPHGADAVHLDAKTGAVVAVK